MSTSTPAPRRRGPVIAIGIAAVAVAAGVGVGFLVAPSFGGGTPSPTPSTTTSSTTGDPAHPGTAEPATASPSTPGQSPSEGLLPVSAPLPLNQLIVPMKVGGNWDLYLAQTGSDKPVRKLVGNPGLDSFPVLSPDRRSIVYVNVTAGARSLRVAAADGSGDRRLFPGVAAGCAERITRPAWNPADPTMFAVPCRNEKNRYGLYLLRTDGSLISQVDLGGRKVGDPTWNADGSKLAFWLGSATSRLDGGAIYVAGPHGEQPQQVSDGKAGQDADPAWSPDGKTLVFRRALSAKVVDLMTVPADGSAKPRVLLHDQAVNTDPCYAPSGATIAYDSTAAYEGGKRTRVWLIDVDGTSPRPLWPTAPSLSRDQSTPVWARR